MKLIKIAPEQNRIAAALVLAAVAGIGLTIWRCQRTSPVRAMPQGAQVPRDSAPAVPMVTELPTGAVRNPFKRPAWALTRSHGGEPSSTNGVGVTLPLPPVMPELPVAPMTVQPIGPEPSPAEMATAAKPKPDEVAAPDCALLATVRTSGRLCAAIRIGDSRVKVVQVGEIVGDGFKVTGISSDFAVLTNGTKTLIAKRASPKGSRSQQEHTDDKT